MTIFLPAFRLTVRRHPFRSRNRTRPHVINEEENYVLQVTDKEIRCFRPDGTLDSLSWKNLRRVEVVVTKDDPLPGTFFALHGPTAALVIPEGAKNAEELSERLFRLPGFDADTFVDSMSSQEQKTFVCWERPESKIA